MPLNTNTGQQYQGNGWQQPYPANGQYPYQQPIYNTPYPTYTGQPVNAYNTQYQQQQYQQQNQYTNATTTNQRQQKIYPQGIPWVEEADAVEYEPPPGDVTVLWVKNRPEIYLKSRDNMGRPVVQILEYHEKPQNAISGAPETQEYKDTTYALKSDVEQVQAEIEALRKDFEPLRSLAQDTPRKRRTKPDEE